MYRVSSSAAITKKLAFSSLTQNTVIGDLLYDIDKIRSNYNQFLAETETHGWYQLRSLNGTPKPNGSKRKCNLQPRNHYNYRHIS